MFVKPRFRFDHTCILLMNKLSRRPILTLLRVHLLAHQPQQVFDIAHHSRYFLLGELLRIRLSFELLVGVRDKRWFLGDSIWHS